MPKPGELAQIRDEDWAQWSMCIYAGRSKDGLYEDEHGAEWEQIRRPRGIWLLHRGGPNPAHGLQVRWICRETSVSDGHVISLSDTLRWEHDNDGGDIIGFLIEED